MAVYDQDNVFAKILRGELPARKIHEDVWALAFYDHRPREKVHALVIPKNAYVDYGDFIRSASSEEVIGFFRAVHQTVGVLGLEHFQLRCHTGIKSGQEVFHFHMHITSSGI